MPQCAKNWNGFSSFLNFRQFFFKFYIWTVCNSNSGIIEANRPLVIFMMTLVNTHQFYYCSQHWTVQEGSIKPVVHNHTVFTFNMYILNHQARVYDTVYLSVSHKPVLTGRIMTGRASGAEIFTITVDCSSSACSSCNTVCWHVSRWRWKQDQRGPWAERVSTEQ